MNANERPSRSPEAALRDVLLHLPQTLPEQCINALYEAGYAVVPSADFLEVLRAIDHNNAGWEIDAAERLRAFLNSDARGSSS